MKMTPSGSMAGRCRSRSWNERCEISASAEKSTLALQADKKASFGIIIKVMDALKLAGVKNLPAFTHGEK